MGAALSTVNLDKETPIQSRSLGDWLSYDNYIRSASDTISGKPINSLKGEIEGEKKITYQKSSFNSMSEEIKRHIRPIQHTITNAINNKKPQMLKRVLNYPAITRVFQDVSLDSGKKVVYLPVYIFFDGKILNTFSDYKRFKDQQKFVFLADRSEEVDKLFNGEYDRFFDDFKSNNNSWVPKNSKGEINLGKASVKAKTQFKIYDKMLYDKIIPYMLGECKAGNIVNAQCIAARGEIGHVVSAIFWQNDDTLNCGIYDPMYFVRDKGTEYEQTYSMPVATFYIVLKFIAKEYGFKINIKNLSSYCQNSGKGSACLQYYMNAEYCPIYSMYFFLMFAKNGFKCDDESLRKTVLDTYVVSPGQMTRAETRDSLRFRIVIMSFILTVLTLVSNRKEILEHVLLMNDTISMESGGIEILEPSIMRFLVDKLTTLDQRRSGGSRRKTRKIKKHLRKNSTGQYRSFSTVRAKPE